MNLFITVIAILVVSNIFLFIAKKLKIPRVVALIFSGLIVGFPFIRNLIIEPNSSVVTGLGDLALILMMFFAGIESSWKIMLAEEKDAFLISIFAVVIPLILGFIAGILIRLPLMASVILGICISITAEGTTAKLLIDLKKIKTRVASAIMSAGIIDDILGLSLFVLLTYLLKTTYLKEDLLIASVIIAFFIGVIVPTNIVEKKAVFKAIEKTTLWLITPFFFVSMGMNFSLDSLFVNPSLLAIIIVIAVIGKLGGVFLAGQFMDFNFKQLNIIGWAMNSRGAVEMALALIAFRSALIPVELYSSLIVTAFVTTLIFPFIITGMIKKDPKIMD